MTNEIAKIDNNAFQFNKSRIMEAQKEMNAKLEIKRTELQSNVAMNEQEKEKELENYSVQLQREVERIGVEDYNVLTDCFNTVSDLITECFYPIIEKKFDKTKSAVETREEIDVETFHCLGANVLVKFETVSDKATQEFFAKLEEKGLTLRHINYILSELPKWGVQGIDENMLERVRTQVGNMDFSKTEGTIVKIGKQAIEFFDGDVLIGDTVYVYHECGLCYKDKDNNLYRLMEARNINAVVKKAPKKEKSK